ncbi:putative chromosome-partitioning protein ParB [Corynebacterium kalinowskii]|uniref:Chromosome-partitioning protein ParB n=1 Tax=Corynebacterium kalinowskii TaxID=2675216 RepID=A0A6B8W0Z1_9CORY|nr:ParB/RepB/Spo0J family partition protein [Corynebacterium kalinowskii]QGU03290.1 putative chromosome-partitioning protein ParB [Corynebacterium kalinowskii]
MANETRKGGLGRGLAALIPSAPEQKPRLTNGAADIIIGGHAGDSALKAATPKPAAARKADAAAAEQSDTAFGATYREIPINSIRPNPKQPRQVFDPEALNELVHSIKEFGLMQPIVVREKGDGYELIMGERRWRASGKAGLQTIPAIVRNTDDGDMLRDALLENIHRAQLNPLEEAAAYQQLLDEFGVTQAELAEKIGRSRPLITNMIRLLALPVPVQRKVAAGVLSAGHARALLGLKAGAQAQEELATRIVAEGLSVRATEEAVTLMNRGDQPDVAKRTKTPPPAFATEAASRLGDRFETRVSVQVGKRKGKIVVEFGDHDDFQRIMDLLEG